MARTPLPPGKKAKLALRKKESVWNLTPLFEIDDDPRMEQKRKIVERKGREFINAWKDRTDYLEDPAILRLALDQYESWKRRYGSDGDEGYYFWLRTQQDQLDPELKARFNKIEEFSKKIENDIQFFYLRIAKIKPEDQRRFLEDEGLAKYRHYLDRIFAEARYHYLYTTPVRTTILPVTFGFSW